MGKPRGLLLFFFSFFFFFFFDKQFVYFIVASCKKRKQLINKIQVSSVDRREGAPTGPDPNRFVEIVKGADEVTEELLEDLEGLRVCVAKNC